MIGGGAKKNARKLCPVEAALLFICGRIAVVGPFALRPGDVCAGEFESVVHCVVMETEEVVIGDESATETNQAIVSPGASAVSLPVRP